MGLHPKPALLFSLQKSKQKASTPGSHKIYFYPGILQLPTVGQVKCLYNSVKNKFYRRLQRGAKTANNQSKKEERHLARMEEKSTLKRGRLYLIRECFKKKLIFRFGGLLLGRSGVLLFGHSGVLRLGRG